MNSLTAHFGLGTATTIDQVVIEWPSGTVDVIDDVQPNEQLTFVEGDNVLSVPENAISTINVFPNPTADFLNFSQEGLQHSKIQIVDANGKLVLNTTISANGSVDVTSLSSGVYIAMLQVNKQFESFKFVKM